MKTKILLLVVIIAGFTLLAGCAIEPVVPVAPAPYYARPYYAHPYYGPPAYGYYGPRYYGYGWRRW